MPVSRRMLLSGIGLVAAAGAASAGEACSITARLKPIGFSDAACRRSLRELVKLINATPNLSDEAVSARAAQLGINFDTSVSDAILNYPNRSPTEDLELFRAWGSSGGKPDRSPVGLREENLLKGERGVAIYQFTLRRDRYHPEVTEDEAAGDSCGMPYKAFYGPEDSSYLGVFKNNKLREVSAFDVWLRTI